MGVVKHFSDGSFLEFARGSFDDWCVYITTSSGERMPPLDVDYFRFLKYWSSLYSAEKIYADFIGIYEMTGAEVEESVLVHIETVATTYEEKRLEFEKVFTILYMAMIAEENKAHTRLGKRIKRLGLHVLLLEGAAVEYAADFMRKKGWREIDALCKARGF